MYLTKFTNSYKELNDKLIKPVQGSNLYRIFTRPYMMQVHIYNNGNGNDKYIPCSMFHGICAICESNNVPIPLWLIGVKTHNCCGTIAIHKKIFEHIQMLCRSPWGDPDQNDYLISFVWRSPNYIQCIPFLPEMISVKIDKPSKDVKLYYSQIMQNFSIPPTYEEIKEMFEKEKEIKK